MAVTGPTRTNALPRVAVGCLATFAVLTALVVTHAVDAADLRADLLLAHLVRRLDLVDAVRDLYAVSSEALFETLVAAGVVTVWLAGRGRIRRMAIAIPVALVGAELVARVLAALIHRPRPFVAHPALFMHVGQLDLDPSFPSDGATAAFAIATVVTVWCPRLAFPALTIAGAVCLGRLLVAVHYPSDVLGGALVGIASAVLTSLWLARDRGHEVSN